MLVVIGLALVTGLWGAVTGAFFLTALPQFLQVFETYEVLIFGAILVVCMMYLPDGITGGGARLARWALGRRAKPTAETGDGHER